jgi:hypothetical protein
MNIMTQLKVRAIITNPVGQNTTAADIKCSASHVSYEIRKFCYVNYRRDIKNAIFLTLSLAIRITQIL